MGIEHPDPGALLRRAYEMESGLRRTERSAALDELQAHLDAPNPPSEGHDPECWQRRVLAERAIDLVRELHVPDGLAVARDVLTRTSPTACDEQPCRGVAVAHARATEALGRGLAWTGTEGSTLDADRALRDAAEQYAVLGEPEWHAYALFWRGNAVHLQNGELAAADDLMRRSLDLLPRDSLRRPSVMSFRVDVLQTLGEWDEAERLLVEARELAVAADDRMSRAYVAWSRARLASVRDDAMLTERLIRETERDAADWFTMHTGWTFLADAAEMLDRVGLSDQAREYLARAQEHDPADEFVRQASAALLARGGDPVAALDALQELSRGDWLEKRLIWRFTLLAAWATFRAGREGAGDLAARALERAQAMGSIRIATRGEPALVAALVPTALEAGSALAAEILAPDGGPVVRLFGRATFLRAGEVLDVPPGKPGELARMVAASPDGVGVDVALDRLFPDADGPSGRQRLRQVLTRLRTASGELVVRDGDVLRSTASWVDLRAFGSATARVRSARGARRIELAYAAIALWRGTPLSADSYADWALELRDATTRTYLGLLDLVADDAAARGSHHEALTALLAAAELDPDDPRRAQRIAVMRDSV